MLCSTPRASVRRIGKHPLPTEKGGLIVVEALDFGFHELEAGSFGRQFGLVWLRGGLSDGSRFEGCELDFSSRFGFDWRRAGTGIVGDSPVL